MLPDDHRGAYRHWRTAFNTFSTFSHGLHYSRVALANRLARLSSAYSSMRP
jgi:hypothetical protein